MVKIITGKMNSGKTTRIKEHYLLDKLGDGIISRKVMIDKDVYGYKASRLSDNLEFSFMIHDKYYQENLFKNGDIYSRHFCNKIGPYWIYKKGMKRVLSIYKNLIKEKVSPIYFDEIGKFEIQCDGFYKPLKNALKKNLDVIFTIREDLIEELVDKMNISNYEIIGR
ncbi:MAG: hypothetical protein JEZ05_05040 [Tenericutes bacterium]|nr:hypothetical protein [Mycoplasmatota bacterium]